jgi:endonuclease-8
MPEGDTLHRTAATLARALNGQKLVKVTSTVQEVARAGLMGHLVESVVALGKNLVIRFDDGRMLHTHLRMQGSWHLYRPHERWRRPEREARVVLDVGDIVAVCFAAPTVRLLRGGDPLDDARLGELGPDIIPDDFDESEALERLRARDVPIGEAVLDQTAVAGIGNIYKSEALFLCRAKPFANVATFEASELAAIIAKARALTRANIDPAQPLRTTRMGGRYWVYRRSGQPCFRCQTTIRMRRQGELHRSTYYCPRCQKIDAAG